MRVFCDCCVCLWLRVCLCARTLLFVCACACCNLLAAACLRADGRRPPPPVAHGMLALFRVVLTTLWHHIVSPRSTLAPKRTRTSTRRCSLSPRRTTSARCVGGRGWVWVCLCVWSFPAFFIVRPYYSYMMQYGGKHVV